MIEFEKKEHYTVYDLAKIVQILRAPGGCPWDAQQTHVSIRRCFIEEVYEACEAIDTGDTALLQEELGDVLLQVLFHAQIEQEQGHFTLDDVADGNVRKMMLRHPHVFGDVQVDGTQQVLENWDQIKMQEKNQKSTVQVLQAVSAALPALIRSEKLVKKSAKAGVGPQSGELVQNLPDQLSAYTAALGEGDTQKAAQALGALLFSLTGTAALAEIGAEEALGSYNEQYIMKFTGNR